MRNLQYILSLSLSILFYTHVALLYPRGIFLFSHRKFKFVTAPLKGQTSRYIFVAYITTQPRLLWWFYTSRLARLFWQAVNKSRRGEKKKSDALGSFLQSDVQAWSSALGQPCASLRPYCQFIDCMKTNCAHNLFFNSATLWECPWLNHI